MELEKAKEIYSHPKGHSKEELKLCLLVLNDACQPVELGKYQFEAIKDAIRRVGQGALGISKRISLKGGDNDGKADLHTRDGAEA